MFVYISTLSIPDVINTAVAYKQVMKDKGEELDDSKILDKAARILFF